MKSLPSAGHFRALLFLGALLWGAPSNASKPLSPVEVTWSPGEPAFPGSVVHTEIRIRVLRGVEGLAVTFADPGFDLLDPLPELGGAQAEGTHVFPLRVRMPNPLPVVPPALAVRFATPTGEMRLSARLDLSGSRPSELPRRALSADGSRLEVGIIAPHAARIAGPQDLVTARFLYRDRPLGPDGFTTTDAQAPSKPVRFASVELLEDGAPVGTGHTDVDGQVSFDVLTEADRLYQMRILTDTDDWAGAPFRVLSPAGATYAFLTGPVSGGGAVDFGDISFAPDAGGEEFNVFDTILDGAFFVESLAGTLPTAHVDVTWPDDRTRYKAGLNREIELVQDDGYDDPVILHEYGHYVSDRYSKDDNPGGFHFVNVDTQDPRLSWGEGFASYFQSAARARLGDPFPSWYVDTDGNNPGGLLLAYDCEGPSYAVRGAGSEVVVQGLLWDIEDAVGTPDPFPGSDDDALQIPRSRIWSVITGPLLQREDITLEDFWEAWFTLPDGFEPEMRDAFTALGAEYFADPLEPDDGPNTGTPVVPNDLPTHHTFYPAGDRDEHLLALDAGETVTVETLNLEGMTDTRIDVYDPDDVLVVSGDDRGGGDPSSIVSFTATQSGTHRVVVLRVTPAGILQPERWTEFGSYDVRVLTGSPGPNVLGEAAGTFGLADRGLGTGAAFADYDGDGDLDLFVVNNSNASGNFPGSEQDRLYRQDSDPPRFVDVTQSSGLGSVEAGVAAAWADYDNDGDPDLFVSDHALLANNGDGTFTDVTLASGVSDIGREFDAAWLDVDRDGRVDLFVLRRDGPSVLWHNEGDGTFTDITEATGIVFPDDGTEAWGVSWSDYDRDRYPDLFLTRVGGQTHLLYRNLGDNRFQDVTVAAGVASTVPASGSSWADVDADGWPDLFVASRGANRMYRNRGDGTFQDVSAAYGIDDPGSAYGSVFVDYDIDGDQDLFVANLGSSDALFQNLGGSMIRTSETGGPSLGLGAAAGDVDRDGDPDIYFTRGCGGAGCEPNRLYRSAEPFSGRSWIAVDLEGVVSNRDGLGATLWVHAQGTFQSRVVGTGSGWAGKSLTPEVFGLSGSTIDSIEVFWPVDGRYNVVRNPSVNGVLHITEDIQTPVRPGGPAPTLSVRMSPAFPNPFSAVVTVSLDLPARQPVRIGIVDVQGRLRRTLVDRTLGEGRHVVGWDGLDDRGRSVPAGTYFYRVVAGGRQQVQKIVRRSR